MYLAFYLHIIILLLFYSKEVEKNHLNSIQKGGKGRYQSSRKKRGFPGGSVKQNEKFAEIQGVHGKIDLKSKGINFDILRYISSATCLGYRIQRIMIFEEKV